MKDTKINEAELVNSKSEKKLFTAKKVVETLLVKKKESIKIKEEIQIVHEKMNWLKLNQAKIDCEIETFEHELNNVLGISI